MRVRSGALAEPEPAAAPTSARVGPVSAPGGLPTSQTPLQSPPQTKVASTAIASPSDARAQPSAWLRVEGITKRYGTATVLDGVDLALDGCEFVCLLGPSGCGKTTLLRILCGIETADAGRVCLQGQDITHGPAAERQFGVVFQSYALFPNLTALDNVAYGLARMQRRQRVERAREMLELVGLAGHAIKYPAQLSGGQQQRVALARALAPRPRLLLLDEPLSALDAQVRQSLRAEIRAIQQRLRVPAIMVTHDQDEALAMADRVVLMHQGRIEQQGDPVALYTRPASGFAARFVGRINLLDACVDAGGLARVGEARLQWANALMGAHSSAATLKLGIRPGHLRLHALDPAAARAADAPTLPLNHLNARIAGQTFCGAWINLHLEVPDFGSGAGLLEAELPTPPEGNLPWRTGDRCVVELPAAALKRIAS